MKFKSLKSIFSNLWKKSINFGYNEKNWAYALS